LQIAADISELPKDKDVDFVRVSSHQLADALRTEALAWVAAIGQSMAEIDRKRIAAVHAQIGQLEQDVTKPPTSLEDLKAVLNVVAEIRARAMDMEAE
jgi:dynein heavy chain